MWIQISAGRGPAECALGVKLFYDYLQKLFSQKGITFDLLDSREGDQKGTFRSLLISVKTVPSELEKIKEGSLLWVCKSPYRWEHKRKNWFFDLYIYEEPADEFIDLKDVVIETMRAAGPGGQHVNKTDSAVRITHKGSGIAVTAREERSQYMNKKLAFARLTQKLDALKSGKLNDVKQELHDRHNSLERGNPVMTFKGPAFRLAAKIKTKGKV